MISIRVLKASKIGAEGAVAQFGPEGGSIGRAPTSTLVLDDSERTVSRMHGQVVCRGGRYFLIDRGSNPTLYNGQTLGVGNEVPLNDGDQLIIGGFQLVVQVQADAAPAPTAANTVQPAVPAPGALSADDDPFADLMAGLGPTPAASAAPAPPPSSIPAPVDVPDVPFTDLLAPPPPVAQPAGSAGALDEFAGLATPVGERAPSIDSMFGLSVGMGGDPLAQSPLADPLHRPNTAADTDPLAALAGGAASPTPAPHSDHVPIGQYGFVPPRAIEAAPAATPPPAAPPPPTPPPPPAVIPPVLPQATPAAMPPPPASVAVSAPAEAKPARPAAAVPRANEDELLAAFLRGLSDLRNPPEVLTPGLMERIGVLLRDAVQGTLQLLHTRQEFKRELRAEVTVIAAQANNPLKFSPSVEVALAHLLGPGMHGFMPANQAMRDAFDDLRAHQFGVMIGMRTALTQLIARFAPDALEKKIVVKSTLDNLFAAHRKAKLWNQFVQFYTEIASEAEEDFHSVFGKAFVQAYEEQMARLESADQSDGQARK